MPLSFSDLPNELIDHIISFLDTTPPSLVNAKEQPIRPTSTPNPQTPLKLVSTVSRRLRKITLPHLFRHILVLPDQLDAVLAYASTQALSIHIATSHIYLSTPSSHEQPPWWAILLDPLLNLTTLTITAPPHLFAELTSTPIKLTDAWAFKIPHQSLQLTCSPPPPTHPYPRYESHTTPFSSILTARPWHTLHINESSSLPSYTTYEYFLRTPPNPLSRPLSPPFRTLLRTIKHFHYTTIFPCYNHVASILRIAEETMLSLESLTVQLLPMQGRGVLERALGEDWGRHIDVNDPWSEFETALVLVAVAACGMASRSGHPRIGDGNIAADNEEVDDVEEGESGNSDATSVRRKHDQQQQSIMRQRGLTQLTIADVTMESMRETIESIVTGKLAEEPVLGWAYERGGVWRRRVGLEEQGEEGVVSRSA